MGTREVRTLDDVREAHAQAMANVERSHRLMLIVLRVAYHQQFDDGEDTVEQRAAPGTPRYVRNGTYAETAAFIEGIPAGRTAPAGLADVWPSADLCFRIEQEAR